MTVLPVRRLRSIRLTLPRLHPQRAWRHFAEIHLLALYLWGLWVSWQVTCAVVVVVVLGLLWWRGEA